MHMGDIAYVIYLVLANHSKFVRDRSYCTAREFRLVAFLIGLNGPVSLSAGENASRSEQVT